MSVTNNLYAKRVVERSMDPGSDGWIGCNEFVKVAKMYFGYG